MDAVSYSHSAKQAKRIKKIINEPDSTSGVVTVPKVIPAGETITIPVGRTAVLPNVQVDGTLTVDGDVFVPSGATYADLENQIGTKADTTYVNNKPSGFKNYIINGGFDVWQRGTSFSSLPSNTYFADRWLTYSPSGTMDLSILTNGTYATNGLIWNKTTSNAEYIIQNIENIRKFINKEVTVSFYIHNNGTQTANYLSGLSYVYDGSTNIYEPNNYSFNLAPQEARLVSFTRTLDYASVFNGKTIGPSSCLQFFIAQPAAQNNNGENIINNVQLEEGSVATPFEQRPYGLELSLCQRYYETSYGRDVAGTDQANPVNENHGSAMCPCIYGNTDRSIVTNTAFKVPKRGIPSITIYGYTGTKNKVTNFSNATDLGGTWTAANASSYLFNIRTDTAPSADTKIWFAWAADAEL